MVRSTIWMARSTPAQKPRGPARRMVSGGFFIPPYPSRAPSRLPPGPLGAVGGRERVWGVLCPATPIRAPARKDPTLTHGEFAYFIAVADEQRNILNKKEYTVSVEFAPRQNRLQVSDQVAIGLPVRDLSAGGKYLIIVGLQLSPEQLDFNRKQRQAQ